MRSYKVLFDELDRLAHTESQSESEVELVVEGPTSHLQPPEGLFFSDNRQNILVERKNAINKMVRNTVRRFPNDYGEQDRPKFPTLRLRPPLTIPDSIAADPPEVNNRSALKKKYFSKLASETSLPEFGNRLARWPSNNVRARIVSILKPEIPGHQTSQLRPRTRPVVRKVRTPPPRPRTPPPRPRTPPPPSTAQASVYASKSPGKNKNEDKDFEIPLEESLKAVETFIRMEKELSIWSVGEYVLAQWKGNGLFYGAKILDIRISGEEAHISILFDSYDVEDTISHKDMRKYYRKDKNYVKKLGSSKVSPVNDDSKPVNKIECAKNPSKNPKEEILRKPAFKRSKVPSCERSNMMRMRKKILLAYQKMRQQKVQVEYFSGEVLKDT